MNKVKTLVASGLDAERAKALADRLVIAKGKDAVLVEDGSVFLLDDPPPPPREVQKTALEKLEEEQAKLAAEKKAAEAQPSPE